MATLVFAAALSHSPLMNVAPAAGSTATESFRKAAAGTASRMHHARPDAIIVFGPDHFRALFYDLMPAFVIGTGTVSGFGDWESPKGPFLTHTALARHLAEFALRSDFDVAISHDLRVDHGITQPIALLEAMDLPVVPVVINCAAPPLPEVSRCVALGRVVAGAVESFPEAIRVAIIGSGGLSHNPPPPPAELAVHGKRLGYAESRDREARLLAGAHALRAGINEDWDRRVLAALERSPDAELASQLTTESIQRDGGNGGQEIRSWLAVAGAAGQRCRTIYYAPSGELVTGMGIAEWEFPA